ncbi:MAG: hypothetical protein ACK47Y_12540 [Dolichospermum sp.]
MSTLVLFLRRYREQGTGNSFNCWRNILDCSENFSSLFETLQGTGNREQF